MKLIIHWIVVLAVLVGMFPITITKSPSLVTVPEGLQPSPPRPGTIELIQEKGGQLPDLSSAAERGIDAPGPTLSMPKGNFNLLVIMVDFSNNVGTVTTNSINQLVFGVSGSVAHYYSEISYGSLTFVTVDPPTVTGWQHTSLHPYNGLGGYVDGDMIPGTADDYGWGTYPLNLQGIVAEVLPMVDPLVNFSNYDNDGDGFVDGVLFTYAGPGAEITGNAYQIWSSAWNMTDGSGPGPILTGDGVWVDRFAFDSEYMNIPYDQTIGIYCHEVGHTIFGLPDLYDYDGSSAGVGMWSLMGSGNWNDPSGTWTGSSPAWPDAWSRTLMGFETPTVIYGNMSYYPFQPVENLSGPGSGNVVRLESPGLGPQEYFLIEYRDNTLPSYDSALPGSGLLIWHIDEEKWNAWELNTYECRYTPCCNGCNIYHSLVTLEQADGLLDLEYFANYGDAGDPFPGTKPNYSFAYGTIPESGSYMPTSCPSDSCVAVQIMTVLPLLIQANLQVTCMVNQPCLNISLSKSVGWALAGSDATYEVTVQNCSSYFEPVATLSVATAWAVNFFDLNTGAPIPYPPSGAINAGGAWRLGMRVNVPSYVARGMGILSSLTVNGSMGGSATLNNILTQVPECILLVDDDRSAPDLENVYLLALQNNKLKFDYWDVDVSGSPDAGALAAHDMVIWFTGMPRFDTLNPRQEIALATYLYGGGQLVFSSEDYLYDVGRSAFNAAYLHVMDFTDDIPTTNSIQGVQGNPVGNGIPLFPFNPPTFYTDQVVALAPATSAFESLPGPLPSALTYDAGTWKVLFLAWPLEYLAAPGPDMILAAAANWMGVPPFPITSFTVSPTLACSESPLTFTNTSQNAMQFLWNFGDGITSTLVSPVHTYTVSAPITYTVNLTGSHCCGFSIYQQPIAVHPMSNADFTSSAVATLVNETVIFTSTSLYAESYLWDFGDGVTSTLVNPTHVYVTPIQADVSLRVNNQCSSSMYTQTITVYGQVEADFTPSTYQAKTGQVISFNNTSKYAETYAWDFGDGVGNSTDTDPTYAFMQVGTYTITLQAANLLSQDSTQAVIVVSDIYTTYLPALLRSSIQILGRQASRPTEIGRLDPRHFQTMCF